ncbi:translocation/assembly module TamB [Mesorhizobium sp. NBSH29]|nr:translocation/assembly module TamB [Mesorhizobium sp. NBSH29]
MEDQLSAPNRKIRITGIDGVLSSNATIAEISIADREGVWLRIENARIVWTRSALLLGRLDIETLAADRIEVLRKPLPAEGLAPEAGGFQLPDLPVAIRLGTLAVPRVTFAADVFGLASEISTVGSISLVEGSLDAALDITRLDGPGGKLTLAAIYANASKVLKLNLNLVEPANGIVANLLSMDGQPPVVLTVAGSGPLDALKLDLTLDANAERVLTGTATVDRQSDGYGFATDFEGPIAKIVAPRFEAFFGDKVSMVASGVVRDAGGFSLDRLNLKSNALQLDASAETANDGFLQRLELTAEIADPASPKTVLPVPGGETTVERAALKLAFGTTATDSWTGSLDITGLTTATFASEKLTMQLGGLAQNLAAPGSRRITFNAEGAATGVIAKRADVQEALGDRIDLEIAGAWNAGQPLTLDKAQVTARALDLSLMGQIAEFAFNGDIALKAENIAPFSALAGRQLSGGLNVTAKGAINPMAGGFDLTVDGIGKNLAVNSAPADAVLAGDTKITGRLARNEKGLTADRLRLFNDQVDFGANGTFASGAANFDIDAVLTDIGLLSEEAAGRLVAKGRASGSDGLIGLNFSAAIADGSLAGKTVRDASLGFEGTLRDGAVDGQISGTGFLAGERVTLASALAFGKETLSLSELDFTTAGTRLSGAVTRTPNKLFDGRLTLKSTDFSAAAALFLQQAKGALDADITLTPSFDDKQGATIKATASSLLINNIRFGSADIEATIDDLLGVPAVNGTISAARVSANGIDVATLKATAVRHLDATGIVASARLENGTTVDAEGALSPIEGGYRLGLDALKIAQGNLAARLLEPAAITVRGKDFSVDRLALDVGGGRVEAQGSVGDTLNLTVIIAELPLAIANTIKPDLRLGGRVNGSARIVGTRLAPDIRFDLSGNQLTAAAMAQSGLSSIDLDARGTSSTSRLTINATVTSPEGLRAGISGGVPLSRDGQLALDVALEAFPLAILNTVAPGQALAGSISGTARVSGALADPTAAFRLRGENLTAKPLQDLGAAPLDLVAEGTYADRAIVLSSANANGPQGLTLSAAGRIPLSGDSLALTLNGDAPLALANRLLAQRGAQVSGTVSLSGSISGSLKNPDIRGMFSTVGASFIDTQSNVRLGDIAVMGTIDCKTVTLRNASAAIGSGGAASASGTISLADGFPANLVITLKQAKYTDGSLVTATVNGTLTVTGALARDPLIGGRIDVERAEITVADSLGAKAAINVRHINPPADVAATLKRAKANDGTPTPSSRPSVARLDITVSAPRRIFVRGRGLDAELGGSVRLTGPVNNIQPVGGFELVRGRLSILAQRITFDEGTVTLVGDRDPFINFVARSAGRDITVFVTVTGRVSDPEVVFSSQPQLPQDEVLAQLIFNRSINELSAFQIAQLAAAAAELAGGSNPSLLSGLRKATGLDDLDIVTDSEGNAAVRAGRYISENVYLGVEAGAGGSAKGTINLDITEDLKARGAVGTNESSVGIFYEKDY